MKSKKRSSDPKASVPASRAPTAPRTGPRLWHYLVAVAAVLVLAFEIYQPAIRGPFLFDDRYLPFFVPAFAEAPLRAWLTGVRPLLMFTYWLNFQISPADPYGYHALNVLFHAGNAILIGLIARKILEWAGTVRPLRDILAVFGGLLFLVHPVQTESVAYIASRSEALSVLLFNGAFTVFLYRREVAVQVRVAIAVLVLFVGACVTKEHAAVLPALLLLTDFFWNPPFSVAGIRRNWKLYAPMAAGAVLASWWVSRILASAKTAGFGLKDLSWYEYFFSQCRAIWVYLRLFVLPYRQNADHEFAVSRTLWDGGALIGLIALVAVCIGAWVFRRRYPLASYGWFAFLILIAPTSSVAPIRDLLVERRLYLPFIGLVLIACEFLRRWRVGRTTLMATLGAAILVLSVLAYQRNQVWSSPLELWKDTSEKSPNKSRPHFQLAYALWSEGRCRESSAEYEKASRLEKPDYALYVDWALALDCAGQRDAALDKLKRAAAIEKNAQAYALMGMVYVKQNRRTEALEALDQAERIDPTFQQTYVYRGNILLLNSEFDKAAEQFKRALQLNANDLSARNGLDMADRRVTPRM